jgi:hypothetical protein
MAYKSWPLFSTSSPIHHSNLWFSYLITSQNILV